MKYLLMHRDIEVATFTLNHQSRWANLLDVHNSAHLPLNMIEQPQHYEQDLNAFLDYRVIPKSRANFGIIKNLYGASNPKELSLRSNMVSISDHYWVKSETDTISWENINFYDNPIPNTPVFIDSIDTLKRREHWSHRLTPNTSNNGTLRQMWVDSDDEIRLYKAGDLPAKQEPFNEVVVSDWLKNFNTDYIPYTLHTIDDENISVCQCFTNRDIEYIPAWQLTVNKYPQHMNAYTNYINQLGKYGLHNVETQIQTMIALDFIVANEDRHWGNFGVLRNSKTLELVSLAPIFDNGNSLSYRAFDVFRNDFMDMSKAFNAKHSKEIQLINRELPIELDALDTMVDEVLAQRYAELVNPIFSEERVEQIGKLLHRQIHLFKNTVKNNS